jgi:hypothetical protein
VSIIPPHIQILERHQAFLPQLRAVARGAERAENGRTVNGNVEVRVTVAFVAFLSMSKAPYRFDRHP